MRKILLIIAIAVVTGGILYFFLFANKRDGVFGTREECEKKTGKSCVNVMCDYIPPEKTYEEVCGNVKIGWQPTNQ